MVQDIDVESIGYEDFFQKRLGDAMEKNLLPDDVRENINKVKQVVKDFLYKAGILDDETEVVHGVENIAMVTHYINQAIENVLKDYIIDTEKQVVRTLRTEVEQKIKEVVDLKTSLEQAMHDDLTGLDNRQYIGIRFDNMIENLRRATRKQEEPQDLSCVFLDIDHFKNVNDTYGHQAGDAVLKQVALAMKKEMFRKSDIAGRWGGEELICILPDCNLEDAKKKAEDIRKAIEGTKVKVLINNRVQEINVTATIGVTTRTFNVGFEDDSETVLEELTACVDDMLYKGKNDGRNTVKSTHYSNWRELNSGENS